MNYKFIFIIIILFIATSCIKEEPTPTTSDAYTNGILVLNEGLFQQNNSSLSWIDLTTGLTSQNVFLNENNRPLGDTGNDMGIYGNKLYIIVNASSTVEVLNPNTMKSIKQISMQLNGQGQQPRQMEFHNGKVYISSYDGFINILDTVSLTISDRIQVGQNPEGIAIYGNNLFVSNSGGLNFPNVDTTVFQIDLVSLSVVDTFVVGDNPGDLMCDDQGDVYVVKRGDYSSTNPSELVKISNAGNVTNLGIPASSLSKRNNELIISYYEYTNQTGNISIYDMSTETITTHSLLSGSDAQTLYGAQLENDIFYLLDAMNYTNSGYVRAFDLTGNILTSYSVGLNPTKIIYYE